MIKHIHEDDSFLTSNQASRFLNVSLSTLKKLIYQGKIKTLKTPGVHHRIPKSSLFSLINTTSSLNKTVLSLIDQKIAFDIFKALISAFETRMSFQKGHSAAVADLSAAIARELALSPDNVKEVQAAAFLHDIGLIGVAEAIINKESPLSAEEFARVKEHPKIGEEIVQSMKHVNGISLVVRQHHERFDGAGYPDGLRGDAIRLEARIINLADAFSTMTVLNSYRKALSEEEALAEIRRNSGTQFDPRVTEKFLEVYRKLQGAR